MLIRLNIQAIDLTFVIVTIMLYRVSVIATYLVLNVSINLLKFIISKTGFAFPLAICLSHMTFTIVTLLPMMMTADYRATHVHTMRTDFLGLLVIGVSFSISIASNNMSLTLISLSLNQMIRSSIPLVTATCTYFVERRILTGREMIALRQSHSVFAQSSPKMFLRIAQAWHFASYQRILLLKRADGAQRSILNHADAGR